MASTSTLPAATPNLNPQDQASIYANVQSHYGHAATQNSDSNYGSTVASAFGYSKEELTNTPSESNLGLSCGNPFVIANLREGETVVDLGSGAGFDVFQAAKKVGAEGKVVGVDMNDEMLSRAKASKEKLKAENVSFIKSKIMEIDLPDASVDCIISNCVINLVPTAEKHLVFNEMFRFLKPKGRIAISDILLKQDLPKDLQNNVALYVGCIAGASKVEEFETLLKGAGFQDILIVADKSDLNVYKTAGTDGAEIGCCGPASKKSSCGGSNGSVTKSGSLDDIDLNEWAASFKIYAVKPSD